MVYRRPRVLIFGGTGSLGRTLTRRFQKKQKTITVFSRDEAKQHKMSLDFEDVQYIIGNIRDYDSVERAIRTIQPGTIINAAAMKQVPTCEFHPYEALRTNTIGAYNVVKAVENFNHPMAVLSISTDKACKPVNSYGMTKALQERIHLNGDSSTIDFNCVRYGNVLKSTGSIIPVFKKMIEAKKQLTVTHDDMTRFFLSLDQAVDLIETALATSGGGKIFVPKVPSARIMDLARIMDPSKSPSISGIRPGEKIHEILVSEEELLRTEDRGNVYVIHDIKHHEKFDDLKQEYSSKSDLMTKKQLEKFLITHGVLDE